MLLKRNDAYAMGLPKYTLMGLVVTCLSVSADQLKQKPQTLNYSPAKNAQLDEVKSDVVPIFLYARDGSLDGDYNFKYETGNGIYAEEHGVMMNKGTENEASSVEGTYRYTSPEGIPIEVKYTAGVDGFRAYGTHLPVSPAAYAPKSLPSSNAGPTPYARPQYRTDNSEPASSYPQPTPSSYPQPTPSSYPQPTPSSYPQPTPSSYPQPTSVPGGTDVAASVQPSVTGGIETRERPIKTPVAEYYSPQPEQLQTVTYPPQQQTSAPLPPQPQPVQPLQFVEPAGTVQPQTVPNSLVARPADYYPPPPPQQFQQPPVPYPRPQPAFTVPTTVPQPQPQPQPAYPTPQPTGRSPTAGQRLVLPGYSGAQQQWFNARLPATAYGPQPRPAPTRQFAVEPQQVRYVSQGRYYQAPPYAPRTGPEPPRY